MNFLERLVASPSAEAFGWALVHSLWEGAIIAAALLAVLLVTSSPHIRYRAAGMALCAVFGGFLVTLIYVWPDRGQVIRIPASGFRAWRGALDLGIGAVPGGSLAAAVVPWLAPLWLAGVCVFCVFHAAGWISLGRLSRRGVCAASEAWLEQLARLGSELRVTKPVRLLESCLADTPMVIDHFRPVIVMPVGLLTGLPASQIEAILLHELAHIKRFDYLVNLWQCLAEGLLFYHPAVWWISHVMRTEREHCCDDVVVALRGDAREYAVALAALEENRWSGMEPAVAVTGGNLVKRVRRLLHPKGPGGALPSFSGAVILLLSAAAVVGAWQVERPEQKEVHSYLAFGQWDQWLADVGYLIGDEERRAFLNLKVDEEKQHFVEQFWLRRDPTPGTPENEFKEEHYRRLAFANLHFATRSGRGGEWTDRGHMYIVYGPPDEIDSHPNAPQGSYPFEMWRYKQVEGVREELTLTFVDREKTGDYKLAPGKPM